MRARIKYSLLCDLSFREYEDSIKEGISARTDKLLSKGCISDSFCKDFRYQMGYIQALKDLLKLNEEVRKENV